MKIRDLEKELKKHGWTKVSNSGKHTKWGNGKGITEPVPRHKEIDERLAKKIIKKICNKIL